MEEKIVCKFEVTKKNFCDYYKTLPIFKVCDCLLPSSIAVSVALVICLSLMINIEMLIPPLAVILVVLSVISTLVIGFFSCAPLIYKINQRNTAKNKCEAENDLNEILFDDDKFVVTENGIKRCITYASIKKIVESESVYSLKVKDSKGIMIPKNSAVNADDEIVYASFKKTMRITPAYNFSNQETVRVVLGVLFSIASFLLSAFAWMCLGEATFMSRGDESDYLSSYITEDNILDTAGSYDDAYFQQCDKKIGPFISTARLLKLDYSSDNYYKQVDFVNNNYSFLDKPQGELLSENEFDIGDWHFKVCADDDYYDYPSFFRTIGFNEKSKSIVYIDFDDVDLDYLCETFEPMEECFIDEYVGYNFRKN